MARPLRIEFAGAIYHLMSRGNARQVIFSGRRLPWVAHDAILKAWQGEVERFRTAKQVGAYAGLTCRVHQSGSHCYHGSITHKGSSPSGSIIAAN